MMVAPLWKKQVLDEFMPIREDLHILEDHELYARILSKHTNYNFINEELIYYRVGGVSLLNQFYKDVTFGLDSFLEAKKTVLQLSNSPKIKLAILKETLSLFRMALAQKKHKVAYKCLLFCKRQKLFYSLTLKLKMIRIYILYTFVLLTKKGDTFFKKWFKV
ncbi:MAG: hypothetical protein HC854_13120 [Flavobacterium sp.]|nr:hypothetical protein [Flavobacterium sp.]